MGRFARVVTVLACMIGLPALAYAQAGIAGTVRDASGAILPGVTVEAASPALIEKVRSARYSRCRQPWSKDGPT